MEICLWSPQLIIILKQGLYKEPHIEVPAEFVQTEAYHVSLLDHLWGFILSVIRVLVEDLSHEVKYILVLEFVLMVVGDFKLGGYRLITALLWHVFESVQTGSDITVLLRHNGFQCVVVNKVVLLETDLFKSRKELLSSYCFEVEGNRMLPQLFQPLWVRIIADEDNRSSHLQLLE